jgi:amino acid transporter
VVRPGNIGALALTFATYAAQVITPAGQHADPKHVLALACGAVVVLTGVNALGLRRATWTQNALTVAKVLGLLALFAIGLVFPARDAASTAPVVLPSAGNFGLAMVMVLFAFGGWEDVTYVAAEIREPRRTLPRALLAGTAAVTAIYLLGTVAFVHSLGWAGLATSDAVAADVVRGPLGDAAARGVSLLVALCAFGAINGMILTGSRISFAAAADHPALRQLGAWDGSRGVPMRSLLLQSLITLALLLLMGRDADAFERMVSFTVPAFWSFYVLVGVALLVLRLREPGLLRPFRVPLFPVTPVLFCLTGLFMLQSGVMYAWDHRGGEAFWAIGAVVSGVILMPLARRRRYSSDGPGDIGVVKD